MKTTDVFRFVMVRPAQTIDDVSLNNRFLPPAQSSYILSGLDNDPTASPSDLADNVLASPNFIKDFNSRGGIWNSLGIIHNNIRRNPNISNSDFVTLVDEVFPTFPSMGTFNSLKRYLWDSLFTSVIKLKDFKQDRVDIISGLRLINILTDKDFRNFSDETFHIKLKLKAIIPPEIYRTTDEPVDTGNGEGEEEPTDDPSGAIQDIRDRINDLAIGINDLTELQKTIEFESRKKLKTYEAPAIILTEVEEKPSIDDTKFPAKTIQYQEVSDGNEIFKLDKEVIAKLGDKNINILQDLKVDVLIDDTRLITKKIDESLKQKHNELHQDFGIRNTSVIGTGTNSQGTTKSYQFKLYEQGTVGGLQRPNDIADSLGIDPALISNIYDNSIAHSLGSVKPLGIGDLLVVKETLLKYDLGEIAHIENVLESESKERVHRRLDRTEETFSTTTESSEETERDLQTTDRYELQRETQKTAESTTSLGAGASFSAKYGPVQIAAEADFSTSSSKSEANSLSNSYAKEIMDKTVSRITESVKEEFIKKTLLEIEETNTHSFDNTHNDDEHGAGHNIVGLYRWVDKYHKAEVFNYGERLMIEFIVPEPAALYIHAKTQQPNSDITVAAPKPLEADFTFESIKASNYHIFLRDYNVQGIKPPPPLYTTITTALEEKMLEQPELSNKQFFTLMTQIKAELEVPDGYVAETAYTYAVYKNLLDLDHDIFETEGKGDSFNADEDWSFHVIVGKAIFNKRNGETLKSMNEEDGKIPIAVRAYNLLSYAITVEVICKRTSEKMDEWKLEVFDAIMSAYQTQKADYDAAVKAAVTTASNDFGTNPALKRSIEQEELQRGCLTLLTNQHFKDFDAVRRNATTEFGYPEINVSNAMTEGNYAKFFNHVLEWDQMTYHFYPYFWGNKAYWLDSMNREDIDPDFEAFLRSGYARVVVPVRAGESWVDAMLYYLETGEIWNGGEAPVIGDPLYLSIVDEIKASEEAGDEPVSIDEETWEVVLPTSLVMLQEGSELPDYSDELTNS